MSQNPQISGEQLNEMIKMVSSKMGADPDAIKENLNNEKVGNIVKNLKPEDASKIQQVLSNPGLAQKIMNSPQAQALIKTLMK